MQAGLNAYSGLTAEQFAEAVLMTPELASVAGGSRKLLAKYGSVAPTYPSLINWVNAGKVLPAPASRPPAARPGRLLPPARSSPS